MNLVGTGKRLADADLLWAGGLIGVGEDEIRTVLEVEAAGRGFDSKNRLRCLFEPHVFYRTLPVAKREQAREAGLAYPKWGAKPYPKDSYPRLLKAMVIDETAALKATSWGLGQIMGENHKLAGYPTPQAMVEGFLKGEREQLGGMVAFIKAKKLDGALRSHDWNAFAKGYNGSAYAQHGYHTKLAKAYAKWAKVPDVKQAQSRPAALVSTFDSETMVKVVQRKLSDLGYPLGSLDPKTGEYDGKLGKLTKSAIRDFRAENGLPLSDAIDQTLLSALDTAKPRSLPRQTASTETVVATVPEVRTNWVNKTIGAVVGAPAGALALAEGTVGNLDGARGYLDPLKDFAGDVPGWVWLTLVAVLAAIIFLVSRHGQKAGVAAFRDGARL